MNVLPAEMKVLRDLLIDELAKGNKWTVYDRGVFYDYIENIQFFRSNEEAHKYCLDQESGFFEPRSINMKGLLQVIEPRIGALQNKDIEYFAVEDTRFDVGLVWKSNLDEIVFDRSEISEFTQRLIKQFGNSIENDSLPSHPSIPENYERLTKELSDRGYEPDFFLALEECMHDGLIRHEEQSFDQLDSEFVYYNHVITKDSYGYYSLDSITGTLYTYLDIDHATISGVNTQELEDEMLLVDWDIDGYRFIKQNETSFQQLCEDPNGRLIAVQLFNNNVPPWESKPDFLSRIENDLRIYPKMDFRGDTTADSVYHSLKTYEEIYAAIGQHSIPDAGDKNNKAAICEKLVRGDTCSLVAPTGPHQGDEVVLSWDLNSKVLCFVFKDHAQLDARQYFTKTNSAQFEQTVKDLEEYPFRQMDNPIKKQLLVEALLDGNKKPVHLERTIVPAEHIDCYIVIERQYPDEHGNYQKPVEMSSYTDIDIAITEMKKLAESFVLDGAKSNSVLLLVGQYNGTPLQFDIHAMPTINSGFLVATITDISSEGYYPFIEGNIDRTIILFEQIFVEKDIATSKLLFSDKHGQAYDIDKGFWKKKEEEGLNKNQPESLLVKNRIEPNRGKTL